MSDPHTSFLELFRAEAESQSALLTEHLLALESASESEVAGHFEPLMRAAHSIKGAARIVGMESLVRTAHVMEDCFVAASSGELELLSVHVDVLLSVVDLFLDLSGLDDTRVQGFESDRAREIEEAIRSVRAVIAGEPVTARAPRCRGSAFGGPSDHASHGHGLEGMEATEGSEASESSESTEATEETEGTAPRHPEAAVEAPDPPLPRPASPATEERTATSEPAGRVPEGEGEDRVVRVSADHLTRLLGLAGESLVESSWLRPMTDSILRLRRSCAALVSRGEALRRDLDGAVSREGLDARLAEVLELASGCRDRVSELAVHVDHHDRRSSSLSKRLYREVVASRMRPFSDCTGGLPRLVRDVARELDKEARLELTGGATEVDRDVLERLEGVLGHLLRNAVDHGIETPDEREAAGKARSGKLRVEARHRAGRLCVVVADDGRGIDLEHLRQVVGDRRLATPEMVEGMSEEELAQFLFLPGFSSRSDITQISGRGVGLDAVKTSLEAMHGEVRLARPSEGGTRFELELPLTLSVLRALLVEIDGESYAFPLSRIRAVERVPRRAVRELGGQPAFSRGGVEVGLVYAGRALELTGQSPLDQVDPDGELDVVVLERDERRVGLVVDRLLEERELVVQPLDPRLGRVPDVSATSCLDDGEPVLVLDTEDLIQCAERFSSAAPRRAAAAATEPTAEESTRTKRILVVDDSLTVREVERKLLAWRGFGVETAVNGLEGWRAVQKGGFDLVVTDIDMPRMDGFELVESIRSHPELRRLPVVIVSYKEREADRKRGLRAGADRYLTKGSFHDESLVDVVVELIGEPRG